MTIQEIAYNIEKSKNVWKEYGFSEISEHIFR